MRIAMPLRTHGRRDLLLHTFALRRAASSPLPLAERVDANDVSGRVRGNCDRVVLLKVGRAKLAEQACPPFVRRGGYAAGAPLPALQSCMQPLPFSRRIRVRVIPGRTPPKSEGGAGRRGPGLQAKPAGPAGLRLSRSASGTTSLDQTSFGWVVPQVRHFSSVPRAVLIGLLRIAPGGSLRGSSRCAGAEPTPPLLGPRRALP
jgi:hypothetical protein